MAPTLTGAALIHLYAVIPALALGAFVLWRPKGTRLHKRLGWIWFGLMIVVDVSAFFIRPQGFSWIHLLAIVNLVSISLSIIFIRRQKRMAHAACMVGAYLGMAGAGVGALFPGRYLHGVLLGI